MERGSFCMNFVFDVDGTLTPSRGTIDPTFEVWFYKFCKENPVYLVTGSDYAKTVEQLGSRILDVVQASYNCAGNAVYVKGDLVYESKFKISDQLRNFLNNILLNHAYPTRTGIHIEDRIGLCNFSIVGRGADRQQRADYVTFDNKISDRKTLVELINSHFPEVEATAGGETGIDIYQRGKDKSQIAGGLKPFTFFGDAIFPGGNDYTIALQANKCYHVKSWKETFELLEMEDYRAKAMAQFFEDGSCTGGELRI